MEKWVIVRGLDNKCLRVEKALKVTDIPNPMWIKITISDPASLNGQYNVMVKRNEIFDDKETAELVGMLT